MLNEIKALSAQKDAADIQRIYNDINIAIDNVNNIKQIIANAISCNENRCVLYNIHQTGLNFDDICEKMIHRPYTETIKQRLQNILGPEFIIYYINIDNYHELKVMWGNNCCVIL